MVIDFTIYLLIQFYLLKHTSHICFPCLFLGKQDNIVQKLIQQLFNRSQDAFLSAAFICWLVQEFDKNRSHSLAVYGMKYFGIN